MVLLFYRYETLGIKIHAVYEISQPTFFTGPLCLRRSRVVPRLNTTFRNRPSQTNPISKLLPMRAFRTPVTGSSVLVSVSSTAVRNVDDRGTAAGCGVSEDCRRCHNSHPTTSSLS